MPTNLITKIAVELLSVLALATKQINQGRFSKCPVRYTLLMLDVSQKICEDVVGEGQDTGCPLKIGSVNEGRRIVGCCTDLGVVHGIAGGRRAILS